MRWRQQGFDRAPVGFAVEFEMRDAHARQARCERREDRQLRTFGVNIQKIYC